MVGVNDQLNHEKSKEMGCVYKECLEPYSETNGSVICHTEDMDTPRAAISDERNIKRSILCPITPTPIRENGDSVFIKSTPLSMESPQSPNACGYNPTKHVKVVALDTNSSPRTPDESVFDPFAPGPDAMLLAPVCKKLVKESRRFISRQLNFDDLAGFPAYKDDNENADTVSEKMFLESFYGNLLEAIILKQAEEFLAENCSFESEGAKKGFLAENCSLESEGLLHTPTSPPPLMEVAETCPGAPVKSAGGKTIKIDPGLCRKLEF